MLTGLAFLILSGAVGAQPNESVVCEATLIEFEPEFLYTLQNDQNRLVDFLVPIATFSILAPDRYAGRTVRIIFLGHEHDHSLLEKAELLETRYEIELPMDYFEGPDGQMIRDGSVASISRQSSLE